MLRPSASCTVGEVACPYPQLCSGVHLYTLNTLFLSHILEPHHFLAFFLRAAPRAPSFLCVVTAGGH